MALNATPEATPKRPMARPPTPKSPATAALQILHVCEVDFCNFANVQNYSTNLTVFALRKGPTGLFGGNRDFFTNKEAYWATSIGSNGPFDSNFSGRFDSNFRNL